MLQFEETAIRRYEILLRDICNSTVERIDWARMEASGITFKQKIQQRFGFDNEKGWSFLTSSLDILGDSQIAIIHFLNSRFNTEQFPSNTGGRYLRLYGVLSAVYIQQSALIQLCQLFKVENKSTISSNLKTLSIIFLRNTISSHPVNFQSDVGISTSYKISRSSIGDNGNITILDENNQAIEFNVFECIFEYQLFAENLFHEIMKVIVNKRYKDEPEHRNTYFKTVEEIKNQA